MNEFIPHHFFRFSDVSGFRLHGGDDLQQTVVVAGIGIVLNELRLLQCRGKLPRFRKTKHQGFAVKPRDTPSRSI